MEENVEEKTVNLSPEEVEQEMIRMAEEHAEDITGMALSTYRQLHPRFMMGIHRLSSKGRVRLLKALMDYPVNPARYQLNEFEREMLEIGSMVLESKFIMIMNTYAENMDAMMQEAEASQETTEEKE